MMVSVKRPKYLLILEPKLEILTLQETAASCIYHGDVISSSDPGLALEILKDKGHPDLIIADSSLFSHNEGSFYRRLEEERISSPIIATCTTPYTNEDLLKYPSITAFIDKPLTAASFTFVMRSYMKAAQILPEFIPVKVDLLKSQESFPFSLHLKLSDENFVKVFHPKQITQNDVEKLHEKSIKELFIRQEDSKEYLGFLERQIAIPFENAELVLDYLETFEKVGRCMKWTPEVMLSAERSVNQAIKVLSKNKKIGTLLRKKFHDPSSKYSKHVGLTASISAALTASLGRGAEDQLKLAMASLIHDAFIEEECYEDILLWNKMASDRSNKEPEILKYRMHPFDAAGLVKDLDSPIPDVEQIIIQHHEVKDGSGFPRGVDASRIGFLPSIFIMTEDLISFIESGKSLETSITDFITWGRFYYDSSYFMRIFASLEEMLRD